MGVLYGRFVRKLPPHRSAFHGSGRIISARTLGLALLLGAVLIGFGLAAADAPAAATNASLSFAVPPRMYFTGPDTAEVVWESAEPMASVLAFGVGEKWDGLLQNPGARTAHRMTWTGLQPKTAYRFRLQSGEADAASRVSETFELDTALNYRVVPIPAAANPFGTGSESRRYAQAAERILAATGVTKGYCLVLDCRDGQLAFELAKRSDLIVVGVDPDRERIQRARTQLRQAGAYGARITLHSAEALSGAALPPSFANLVVMDATLSPARLPATAAQVLGWLQPATGVARLGPWRAAPATEVSNRMTAWLGTAPASWDVTKVEGVDWLQIRRPLPPDTGSWTHQYGDAGNTANSREGLQGAAGTDRLEVQWLGRPGADFGIDRNPRMPAPLAVHGRLFHQGLNRLAALDSYNGALLWSMEIPALRRVNMPRDCGNWCADWKHLFVAVEDRCWVLGAGTGEMLRTLTLPDPELRRDHVWGYVARAEGLLYGSSVKRGAGYTDFWGGESWYDAKSGKGTEKVCSDDLFAVDVASGETRWRYRDGVIINSTIGVAEQQVLFVECRHPDIRASNTGRIGSPQLWEQQYLVALDARTGSKRWEQPIDTADGIVVFFLLASGDQVVLMASGAGKYHVYAFRSDTGKSLWQAEHPWTNDNHGGHLQHPVLARNAVFMEPRGYNVATGELLAKAIGKHGGCATYAATLNALIYRGESGSISMWDMDKGAVTAWHNLRPSCWLSTVPANGMVLSPEGGGGCSCGNWLETSVGFTPAPRSNTP